MDADFGEDSEECDDADDGAEGAVGVRLVADHVLDETGAAVIRAVNTTPSRIDPGSSALCRTFGGQHPEREQVRADIEQHKRRDDRYPNGPGASVAGPVPGREGVQRGGRADDQQSGDAAAKARQEIRALDLSARSTVDMVCSAVWVTPLCAVEQTGYPDDEAQRAAVQRMPAAAHLQVGADDREAAQGGDDAIAQGRAPM